MPRTEVLSYPRSENSVRAASRMRVRASGPVSAAVRAGRPRRLGTGASSVMSGGALGGRGEVEPGEGEGLGEVGLAFGGGHRAAGVDLDDHVPVEAGTGQPLQQLRAGLVAPAGHQVLVLVGALAVGQVDVGQPVAHPVDHGQAVRAGGGGVRQVHREVPVVVVGDVPVGGVREHLAVPVAPRVHVLDGEPDVRLVGHPPDPGDEVAGVIALPPERGARRPWTRRASRRRRGPAGA